MSLQKKVLKSLEKMKEKSSHKDLYSSFIDMANNCDFDNPVEVLLFAFQLSIEDPEFKTNPSKKFFKSMLSDVVKSDELADTINPKKSYKGSR